MIFVTVGSTMPFDPLIKAIDEQVAKGIVTEPVICQIGNGSYTPTHCEHFRFRESIKELIDEASIVITHGGTGTVTSLIKQRKRFIAVSNAMGADDHQAVFLSKLASISNIIWTDDPAKVTALFSESKKISPSQLITPSLVADLKAYIEGTDNT